MIAVPRGRALEFIRAALHDKATRYEERAAQLHELAATEPIVQLRRDLVRLADQYAAMAEEAKIKTGGAPPVRSV